MFDMNKVYIFYIYSNFHLLIADNIIINYKIPQNNILFITSRGIKLPDKYADCFLYDNQQLGFWGRIRWCYQNRSFIRERIGGSYACVFFPFRKVFPSKRYFDDYIFFEEGFSAYGPKRPECDTFAVVKEHLKFLLIDILMPFFDRKAKGLIAGISACTNNFSKGHLIKLSKLAYPGFDNMDGLDVQILTNFKGSGNGRDISNSLIVVMDRLSSAGRPFNVNTYLDLLKEAILKISTVGEKLYVKMHPADFITGDTRNLVTDTLSDYNMMLIYDNLENLASCNRSNTFLGTNSTILYYAPILGPSNRSVSFARQLAEKDGEYCEFLGIWGGVDAFCDLFSENVDCV